jgi:hypothetical protein
MSNPNFDEIKRIEKYCINLRTIIYTFTPKSVKDHAIKTSLISEYQRIKKFLEKNNF